MPASTPARPLVQPALHVGGFTAYHIGNATNVQDLILILHDVLVHSFTFVDLLQNGLKYA